MAKEIEKLRPATVAALSEPGMYGDGLGLYLQISENGGKSWIFRYQMLGGPTRYMGLGSVNDFTLREARDRAAAARRLKADNKDPIEEAKKARNDAKDARETARKEPTFEQATQAWFDENKDAWTSEKHRELWIRSMRMHVFPRLGRLPVSTVDTTRVLSVLRPIWKTKNQTALRLRGRIETVLAAAKVAGFGAGENPARWDGHLDAVLAAPSQIAPATKHAALPYAEIPTFMTQLRVREGIPARALELIVLAGVRTGEALGAEWSEFDLDGAVWNIPGPRMKMRKPHSIPLCDRAVEILRGLPRERGSDWVFIGAHRGKHLGKMVVPDLMDAMGRTETVHGFRSSFRTWAAECTDFPREICEAALSHYPGGTEGRYQRGDFLVKRRALMAAWAGYCGQPPRQNNVTPLRPQRIITDEISMGLLKQGA